MSPVLVNIFAVGAGSCVGGVARYLLSSVLQPSGTTAFPWGTFAVNILGCLAIGLIYGLLDRGFTLPGYVKLFLTAGFCGGFTTFSTFIHENYLLFNASAAPTLWLYLGASLLLGVAAAHLGHYLATL